MPVTAPRGINDLRREAFPHSGGASVAMDSFTVLAKGHGRLFNRITHARPTAPYRRSPDLSSAREQAVSQYASGILKQYTCEGCARYAPRCTACVNRSVDLTSKVPLYDNHVYEELFDTHALAVNRRLAHPAVNSASIISDLKARSLDRPDEM